MKKKTIIALITSILLVLTCGIGITYAWLTYKQQVDLDYKVGSVAFEITQVDKPVTELVPGQPLSNFKIVNKSTIVTDMRIKITISSKVTEADGNEKDLLWKIGTNDKTDQILVTLPSEWSFDASGYLAYNSIPAGSASGVEIVKPFATIKINPTLVSNEAMGAVINIKYEFEAKQHDYVDWASIGEITLTSQVSK